MCELYKCSCCFITTAFCPHGNRASWCSGAAFFPGFCYNQQSRNTCCVACMQHNTGPPGESSDYSTIYPLRDVNH